MFLVVLAVLLGNAFGASSCDANINTYVIPTDHTGNEFVPAYSHPADLAAPFAGNTAVAWDHIYFQLTYPRYFGMINITGEDGTLVYNGSCISESARYIAHSSSATHFFIDVRIPLASLAMLGFSTDLHNISGQFWVAVSERYEQDGMLFDKFVRVRFPIWIVGSALLTDVDLSTQLQVYGPAIKDAKILLFAELPDSPNVHLMFMTVVQHPFQLKASANTYLQVPYDITVVSGSLGPCIPFPNNGKCFQQYQMYIAPGPNVCLAGGRRDFDGDYFLIGETQCQPGTESWCTLPDESWTQWNVTFPIDSNDICLYVVKYSTDNNVIASMKSYPNNTYSSEQVTYVADNVVYFKTWVTPNKNFAFVVKNTTIDSITIGVLDSERDAWDYYPLYPTASPAGLDSLLQLHGPTPYNGSVSAHVFDLTVASAAAILGLFNLETPRPITIRVNISVEYDWPVAATQRISLASDLPPPAVAFPGVDMFVGGSLASNSPKTSPSGPASGTHAVAIGVGVACAAVVAAVAIFLCYRWKKSRSYSTQSDDRQ